MTTRQPHCHAVASLWLQRSRRLCAVVATLSVFVQLSQLAMLRSLICSCLHSHETHLQTAAWLAAAGGGGAAAAAPAAGGAAAGGGAAPAAEAKKEEPSEEDEVRPGWIS